MIQQLRRVARDAYVSYRANRYSVPWRAAGQEVFVREADGSLEIVRDRELLARHPLCPDRHQVITLPAHHVDMPLSGDGKRGKTRITLQAAPTVEQRPLAVYEALAMATRGRAVRATEVWMSLVLETLHTTLSTLGLSAVDACLEAHLEQAAKAETSYAQFLCDLLEEEVTARKDRVLATRLRVAHLPYQKTLSQFDFSFQPSHRPAPDPRVGDAALRVGGVQRDPAGPAGRGKDASGDRACDRGDPGRV